jgi:hypothetical protein
MNDKITIDRLELWECLQLLGEVRRRLGNCLPDMPPEVLAEHERWLAASDDERNTILAEQLARADAIFDELGIPKSSGTLLN